MISNVQDFMERFTKSKAESYPKVMAQAVRKSAVPAPEDAGLALSGAQRVPASSKFAQKQSLFDSRGSEASPWGTSAVRLMGSPSPVDAAPRPAPKFQRAVVLAQAAPALYPELDRILERQASTKPFTHGEAQALLGSIENALARVSAPENKSDACITALAPEALTSAATLKNRLSQAVASMKTGDVFEATGQELSGAEKVLECATGLSGKSPSALNIGAWIILTGAVAGLIYILVKKK